MNRTELNQELELKKLVLTQPHIETHEGVMAFVPSLLEQLRQLAYEDGLTNVSALNIQIGIARLYGSQSVEDAIAKAVKKAQQGTDKEVLDLLRELTSIAARIREATSVEGYKLKAQCKNCEGLWQYDTGSIREYLVYEKPEYVPCLSCQESITLESMQKI